MKRLSDLLFLQVVDTDGRVLGHVMDLLTHVDRARAAKGAEPAILEITYGKTGLLEQLGFRQVNVEHVPWKNVVKIERGKMVVQAPAKKARSRRASSRARARRAPGA